jgi:ubiquinone/menaquinone biosynthesis C-methylase UbiE
MEYSYIGNELEYFRLAHNWKSYYAGKIIPFLGNNVLEVGAGIGSTTKTLCDGSQDRWICLEPDVEMSGMVRSKIDNGELPACCEAVTATTKDLLREGALFDSILYIDVLEHIEDDRAEIETAAALLKPGGHLFVLAPAHQRLFTQFDKAIGHFRRYNRQTLTSVAPSTLKKVRLIYLDSVGALASVANKIALRQSMPTHGQIRFWDRLLIPLSRVADPLFRFKVGKSILGIWQQTG